MFVTEGTLGVIWRELLALKKRLNELIAIMAAASGSAITALTGDVSANGPGSASATIANDAVTYAKIQNVSAASTLLGRGAGAGSGDVQEIAIGTNLSMSGTTLNATGGGLSDGDYGDITVGGSGTTLTIDNDAVTYAKIQNISAASKLLGRGSAAGSGDTQEIALGSNLTMSGTTLNAAGGGGGAPTASSPSGGFYLYDGTNYYAPIYQMTPPVDANYAWINQGGASVASSGGAIHLNAPASGSMNIRIRKKAAPSTPYTITVWLAPKVVDVDYTSVLFGFRESSSGKLHHFRYGYNSATGAVQALGVIRASSPTADTSADFEHSWGFLNLMCLRIADNGTNRIFSYSTDGMNFIDWFSCTRLTHLTTSPDEVYFGADTRTASYPAGVTLLSWVEA